MPDRRTVLAATVLALLGACAAPRAPGSAACVPKPLARLTVEFRGGIPTVALNIDGKPVVMALDLGAEVTVLAEATADRLDLARDPSALPILSGVGGSMVRWAATTRHLTLDGLDLRDRRMEIAPFAADTVDGLLGLDVLLGYDIDWDLAHRRVTLNAAAGCSGPPAGWPPPAVAVPLGHPALFGGTRGRSKLLLLPVAVDGRPMSAMLDTGSSGSLVAPAAAAMLEPQVPGADRRVELTGIGPGRPAGLAHRFRSLAVAGATLPGWEMIVAPVPPWAGNMILGVTYLRTRRAWLPAGGSGIWFGPQTAM